MRRVQRGTILAVVVTAIGCGLRPDAGAPGGPAGARLPTPSAPGGLSAEPARSPVPGTTPEPVATPAPPRPLAFSLGPDSLLFYYDPASQEVYPVPGAGTGVFNAYFMDDDRRITFDQDGLLWAWDLEREQKILFSGTDDLGPVFAPDMDGNLMLFHSSSDVYLWQRLGWPGPWPSREYPLSPWASPPPEPSPLPEVSPGPSSEASPNASAGATGGSSAVPAAAGSPSPSGGASPEPSPAPPRAYRSGSVGAIAPFRTLGALHGGILDARIDDPGRTIVAVTADGALWVYWRPSGVLRQIADARSLGDGVVRTLDIDLPGRMVVVSTDTHLFMIDLFTGLIDPLPFANRAFNAVKVYSPTWITADEFYYLAEDAAGRVRILLYNWRTEAVRALTIVNNVLDAEHDRISDQR